MSRHRIFPWKIRLSPAALALILIVIAGGTLRLYHLDWDEENFLHPDELHVVNTITSKISIDWPPDFGNLTDPDHSHLNPRSIDPDNGHHHNFAYGALPLIVTDFAASVLTHATGRDWHAFSEGVPKVGRFLSTVMDLITIVTVFLIGRRLYSTNAGLAAAAIYATAPVPIQLSHFFTTDIWMTSLTTVSIYGAVRAAQDGKRRWFAFAGFAFGLAMASKASVAMLAVVIGVAAVMDAVRRNNANSNSRDAIVAFVQRLVVGGVAALAGFALFEPYALVRLRVYLDQLDEQKRIASGSLDVPYTRQYIGLTRGVYQAEQLLKWGLGPVAGLLCFLGVLAVLRSAYRDRFGGSLLLLVWLVGQGIVTILPQTKFLRYTEPLLPVLAVGAGALLVTTIAWTRPRIGRMPVAAATTVLLAGIAFWTSAFMNVYAAENPRITASRWLYANAPAGSRITQEIWDNSLPLSWGSGLNLSDKQYEMVSMDLYGDREPAKVADDIYGWLSQADYVVLSSNRLSSSMPQSPWRYPVQIRYYQLLAEGKLGYTLAARFQTEPKVGPFSFDDSHADESFINYDHPLVLIYQKTNLVDRDAYDQLMASAVSAPWTPTRNAPKSSLMLDKPVSEQPVVSDARWSASVTGHTLPALLVWLLLLIVLQIVGFPITCRLFPRFPDLGWGFSRLVSTLLAAYAVWILASLELISFRAIWSGLAFAGVAALAVMLARGKAFRARLRTRWPAILGAELVFWATFALFLVFRFINPDSWHPIWGGEKPMEFAHLNAILRSAHFPPYDPWFSDGYINYYYYGTYLVAFWLKLTGIPSEIAFNLAQPTVIALIASAGFSVAAALSRDLLRRKVGMLGGFLGAILLVIAGNLENAQRVIRLFPDQIRPNFDWTWDASRAITGAITEFPYFTGLYADLHAHVVAWPITLLAIGLAYSTAQQPRLFAVGLSVSRRRRPALLATLGRIAMLVVVLGSLFATNAWDVPVYAALTAIGFFMATSVLKDIVLRLVLTGVLTAVTGAGAYVLFLPFFTHYVALFGSLDRTHSRTDLGQLVTHFGTPLTIVAIGLLALSFRQGLAWRWLAMVDPAVLAAVFVGFVGVLVLGIGNHPWIDNLLVIITALTFVVGGANLIAQAKETLFKTAATAVLAFGGFVSIAAAVDNRLTFALALAFAATGACYWLVGTNQATKFVGALIAAAMSIVAGIELVYLADDLKNDPVWYRMNTIFKFYNQTWAMLALAAASLLTMMLFGGTTRRDRNPAAVGFLFDSAVTPTYEEVPTEVAEIGDSTPARDLTGIVFDRWRQVGLIAAMLLIAGSFCYPVFATGPRLGQRFPGHPGIGTLNALDWMHYGTLDKPVGAGVIGFADDLKAIDWFNTKVDGTPVIVEASIGPYRGNGSRFSIATGLPAVLGWDRHEHQQRYPEGIDERFADVRTLYQTDDVEAKMEILRKYNVEYVIVGDVERYSYLGSDQYATPEGIAAFDTMVGKQLEIAFQSGTTTIYRVLPAANASSN